MLTRQLTMPNKYSAVVCEADGITFASKAERRRYFVLKVRQERGEISGLQVHPSWPLEVNGVKLGRYSPDFVYWDNARAMSVVEDVKSRPTKTRDYILRKKLMLALHGVTVEEVA